jgi:hypothetical protein
MDPRMRGSAIGERLPEGRRGVRLGEEGQKARRGVTEEEREDTNRGSRGICAGLW